MKLAIRSVHAREILDSRGNPTVEAEVVLENERAGRAAVPSGASTGAHEAVELRDGDQSRFVGKGVRRAVENVNSIIAPALVGEDVFQQRSIDQILINLDGSPNKMRLGANAILSVSMAAARAAAAALGSAAVPLPRRHQCLHPAGADDEYPQRRRSRGQQPRSAGVHDRPCRRKQLLRKPAHGSRDLPLPEVGPQEEGLRHQRRRRRRLRSQPEVQRRGPGPHRGSRSQKAGYKPGSEIYLALDVAASEFFEDGKYHFKKSTGARLSGEQMIQLYERWTAQYPIVSIEDGMAEDDWQGWTALTEALGEKIQLVGDDVFVTNAKSVWRTGSPTAWPTAF